MKKFLIAAGLFFAVTALKAQIKVYSGGAVNLGATSTAPATNAKLQVVGGNAVFLYSDAVPTGSAPIIMAPLSSSAFSSVGRPDFTWWVDVQTGMFHPSANIIGFSVNNSEKMRIGATGIGIGTGGGVTAQTRLDVYFSGNAYTGKVYGGRFVNGNTTSGTNPYVYGIYSEASGVESNSGTYHYGISASAVNANNCVGVSGVATGNGSSPGYVYGGYFNASNSGSNTYGIYATAPVAASSYAAWLNGTVYVNGSGTYTGTWTLSDKQFKKNIDSILNPLAIIKQLNPQSYYYDTANTVGLNFSSEKQYGFVAQDLLKVLPEMVRSVTKPAEIDPKNNVLHASVSHLAVNYNAFIALLTAGMQAQQSKIEKLTDLTAKQDSVNKALQKQVDDFVKNCCGKTGQRTIENNSGEGKTLGLNDETGNTGAAKLFQNTPNPFNLSTAIKCFVPEASKTASLMIFDLNGSLKKTIPINGKGDTSVTIQAKEFIAGMYHYSLIIDGQEIDTKKMILTE